MPKYVENFLIFLVWYIEEREKGKKLIELRFIWNKIISNWMMLSPKDKEISFEWLKPLKDERVGVR